MKNLLALLAFLGMLGTAHAQEAVSYPNEGATGTTVGKLAKFTTANPSTAILSATTDVDNIVGIVIAQDATATTGNAKIAVLGPANCTFDASGATAGHYVINSAVTAGACADGGASRPTATQVIGRVTANVAASASGSVNLTIGFTNAAGGGSGTVTQNGNLTTNSLTIGGTNGTSDIKTLPASATTVPLGTNTYSGNFTASGVPKFTGLSAGTIASGKNLGLDSSNNLVTATVSGGSGCTTAGTIHNLVTDDGAGGCTSDGSANATGGALSLGASGTVGTVALGNATSGTVTLGTVAGALGSGTASLPANTGTLAELNLAQSWTATQTMTAAGPLVLGANSGNVGSIKIFGNTSGDATITVPAAAGTATRFQLPATNGSNTNVLQTDGSGNTSWAAAGGGGITCPSGFTNSNNPTGECVLTHNQSNVAAITFTGLVGDNYTLRCNGVLPITDSSHIGIRFSQATVFKATGYVWGTAALETGAASEFLDTSSAESETTLMAVENLNAQAAGGDTTSFVVEFTGLSKAVNHAITFAGNKFDNTTWYIMRGGGRYTTDTTAIDGIEVVARKSTTDGNITGNCTLTAHAI